MSICNEIENKFYEENKDISDSYYLIFIEFNPYESNIKVTVDKDEIKKNNSLNLCAGKSFEKSLEKWIERLPSILSEKYGHYENFVIGFHGTDFDCKKLIDSFKKSDLNIIFKHYAIKNFDDKLKIIDKIFEEVNSEKELFNEIIDLLTNFRRYLNRDDLDYKCKNNAIKELSNKLKEHLKFYREKETSFIQKEKQKLDDSIGSINENIASLREQLNNRKKNQNKIEREIEEFQYNFSLKIKEIKNKYLSEFDFKRKNSESVFASALNRSSRNNSGSVFASALNRSSRNNSDSVFYCHSSKKFGNSFISDDFKFFVSDLQSNFTKEIKTIVDEKLKKWKEIISINSSYFIFSSSMDFDSLNDFDDLKNKLEENFSDIIIKEKERIERQKEEIEKSFSDSISKIEKEIRYEEKNIKSIESKKQNIQTSKSELLEKIEKQADMLVEI